MTEDELRCTPVEWDLIEVEVALVPEVRERQQGSAIRRPAGEVMDPVGPAGESARPGPVGVQDPDRPALVAALVRAVRQLRATRRDLVRADAVAFVGEAAGHAAGDRDAPELHGAGEIAHVEERRSVRRQGEPRRAARVENPCQRGGHGPSVARRGGQCDAVGGRVLAAAAVVALMACACAPGGGIAAAPPTPSAAAPVISDIVIQSGLVVPWDVAVAPDGRMFVTERPGTISVFESTAKMAKRTATTQVAGIRAMGEAGLLGLALDPDFASNETFYVCASRTDQGEWRNQILRYRMSGTTLALDAVVMRTGIVAAGVHDACRLRFGPDRKLWIATGDAGQGSLAQDAASLNGKVLRINADGTVPYDNPTLTGQPAPGPVYALGLRNPGGMAFHPATGACYVVDAGDQMQDEIDVVTAGANFGWPAALGPGGSLRGFKDPAWSSGTAGYAVAGAVFLTGTDWGSWNDSLVIATLKEQDLRRFSVEGPQVLAREVLFDRKYGRLRSATIAPDGALILTTSNGSGDRIIRVTPAR